MSNRRDLERRPKVLFVDDDPDLRRLLAMRLGSAGYHVETAGSGAEALGRLADLHPDIAIVDIQMNGMDGMQLFDALRQRMPTLPVVVLTAHGSIPDAVDATRRGVFGYLTKPFDSQALLSCVREALRVAGVGESSREEWRSAILSQSCAMETLLRRARLVAEAQASVLLLGESGTGKELFAKAIHRASPRARHPFVAVNCAAIPEALLESELFGHVKGAFTGATADRRGLIVEAHQGSLFLDEIGDMPLPLQAKLLRVLEAREVRPVGSTRAIPVDLRLISATHADLERDVEESRFRADLLYRLNVVTLRLPALEARREDIPLLATSFLHELVARSSSPTRSFAPAAMELLVAARWPGNVRQLHNVVEQCVALCTGPMIPAQLVHDALQKRRATLPTLDEAKNEAERDYLIRVLRITRGNVTHAARLAGRNRTEFYKLLSRQSLEPARYRNEP